MVPLVHEKNQSFQIRKKLCFSVTRSFSLLYKIPTKGIHKKDPSQKPFGVVPYGRLAISMAAVAELHWKPFANISRNSLLPTEQSALHPAHKWAGFTASG
jgi:hypothetical protein